MTMLSGSLLILASAIMFGSAKLAQSIASVAGWRDTPVSMLVIGSVFSLIGIAVLILGLLRGDKKITSGAVLVIAGAIVFGCSKIAMAVGVSTGPIAVPVEMLVIGCAMSLGGLVILVLGLAKDDCS
jgi:hypothetical protein